MHPRLARLHRKQMLLQSKLHTLFEAYMTGWIVIGGLVLLVLFVLVYLIGLYNSLVAMRENVKQALANIDVLLKQRSEEIPKLVATCKQYMGYEQETLTRVLNARAGVDTAREKGDMKALSGAETEMRSAMSGLLAVAENYPDLKAHTSFDHLTSRISGLQEGISDRREGYNNNVTLLNTAITQFPAVLLAGSFGFSRENLLEFSDAELIDHNINDLFAK